jgi:hypothetical protein
MKNAFRILLMFLMGAAAGLVIIIFANGDSSSPVHFIEFIVSLVIAAYLQIILHEAGHLVGGLLSGYRFVSFRVGSITLVKDGSGKLRFKCFKIAGTGGQCLMAPPENVPLDQIPTKLYNAGGALVNLLCATVSLLLLLFCDGMPMWLRYFLAATMAIGFVFALLNGIPLKMGGVANDGYNMLYLNRDKQAVKGFAAQLIINEKQQNGMRLSQMPDEVFDLGGEINYSDPLQANVGLLLISRELDKGNIELAHEQFKELLNSHRKELMPLFRLEAGCELMFTSLVTGDKAVAQKTIDDEMLMKYITKYARVMSPKQRALMAKALLFDSNRAEAERLYNELIARRDSYLMQGEVESDIELMKHLLEAQNASQNQAKSTN